MIDNEENVEYLTFKIDRDTKLIKKNCRICNMLTFMFMMFVSFFVFSFIFGFTIHHNWFLMSILCLLALSSIVRIFCYYEKKIPYLRRQILHSQYNLSLLNEGERRFELLYYQDFMDRIRERIG